MDEHRESNNLTTTKLGVLSLPFRDTFTGKMSEDFNGLSIAQDNQTAVAVAISNLLHRAWISTWLA